MRSSLRYGILFGCAFLMWLSLPATWALVIPNSPQGSASLTHSSVSLEVPVKLRVQSSAGVVSSAASQVSDSSAVLTVVRPESGFPAPSASR